MRKWYRNIKPLKSSDMLALYYGDFSPPARAGQFGHKTLRHHKIGAEVSGNARLVSAVEVTVGYADWLTANDRNTSEPIARRRRWLRVNWPTQADTGRPGDWRLGFTTKTQ